jgi:hypothetical protein
VENVQAYLDMLEVMGTGSPAPTGSETLEAGTRPTTPATSSNGRQDR